MYRTIEKQLREVVDKVRAEATHRREMTPSDVAAEAFDAAARMFDEAIADAFSRTERLTPEQYAGLHNVTTQTVTRWIRVGELAAERTANGYLINRDAVRTERRRTA